jgi:PAS domain S-box-containing protein
MTNSHGFEINILFSLTDPLRVLSINGNADLLLGFSNDDLLTNRVCLKSRIHSDDLDIALHLFSFEAKPSIEHFNIRIRHSDGRIRCIKGQVSKNKNNHTIRLRLQDAKSLAKQQHALTHNPYFIAMMENTDDYIYFKDRNHVFVGASQTLVTITSPSERWTDLLYKTDYDVFSEAYADIYYKLEKMVFSGVKVAHEIQKTIDIQGNHGWVDNRKYPIYDDQNQITGLFGIARDITDQVKREEYEQFRNVILERLAKNEPISDIYNSIVLGLEKIHQGIRCSILLLDDARKHLLIGAAPSFPDFYNQAINGVEIGDGIGSCGSAAWWGKRVIVEEIANHPFWKNFSELAARANLGSCWSQPIISASGQTLGTFAIYHEQKHTPNAFDILTIEQSSNLIAIAIEHEKTRLEIQQLAFYDPLTKLANRRLLFDRLTVASLATTRTGRYGCVLFIDLDNFKGINDTLGHDYGDLLLQQVAQRLLGCVRAHRYRCAIRRR